MDHNFFNKTVGGLFLIGLGVLFMLNQMDLINFDLGYLFATFWPVFIIYFGLKGILFQRRADYGGSYIWNGFVMLLGVYFLLRNLDVDLVHEVDLWRYAGPIVLVLIGLSILSRGPGQSRRQERREQEREERRANKERMKAEVERQKYERKFGSRPEAAQTHIEPEPPRPDENLYKDDFDKTFKERVESKFRDLDDPFPPAEGVAGSAARPAGPSAEEPKASVPPYMTDEHSYKPNSWHDPHRTRAAVNRSNFIGDIYLGQDYWELEPTNISHFIGDTVIDLTKASIPYGETKLIVSAFIGDVKVFVPNDIQVEVSVSASAFIGDMRVLDRYEGGMFRNTRTQTPHYAEGEKKIHLTISMFIGDVFVKRVG